MSALASAKAEALLVALLIVAFGVACRSNATTRTEDITVWQPRGQWSGRALLQTDPFISTTGLVRVTWQARRLSPDTEGTLRIVLHSDVSGRSLASVVEQHGPGSGVKYISEDPRSFFLVIEPDRLEWSVEVAEGLAATRPR